MAAQFVTGQTGGGQLQSESDVVKLTYCVGIRANGFDGNVESSDDVICRMYQEAMLYSCEKFPTLSGCLAYVQTSDTYLFRNPGSNAKRFQ